MSRTRVVPMLVAGLFLALTADASAQYVWFQRRPAPPRVPSPEAVLPAPMMLDQTGAAPGINTRRANLRPFNQPLLGVYGQSVLLSNGQVAVQITSVIPGTAAARVQFDPGDIIVSSNGYLMQNMDNLRWIVGNSGGTLDMWIINVRTGGYQPMTVPL